MPIGLWWLSLDRPRRVAALWIEFMLADRPQVADQRPILGLEALIQRDEPGIVGIRQITTADGLTGTADIASPRPVITGSYAATNSSP